MCDGKLSWWEHNHRDTLHNLQGWYGNSVRIAVSVAYSCKSPTPFQEGSVFQFIDKCPVRFVIFLFTHCMLTELHSLCLPVSLVVHWYNVHSNVILLMWIQSDDFNSHSREHSPETENNLNYCMCSLSKSKCINSDAIEIIKYWYKKQS